MRRLTMITATALIAAAVALPGSSGADPTGACPDGHLLMPVMSQPDQQKDHNNNGLVCKKVNEQGQPIGGPDDTVDDIILP